MRLINLVIGGLTPSQSTERLQELGYAIAIHPSLPLAGAAYAMLSGLAELAGKDPQRDPQRWIPTKPSEFFNLVGLAEWSAIGERYSGREA